MNIAKQWDGFMPYQTWSGVFRDRNFTSLSLRNVSSCGVFSIHHAMVFLGQGHNFQLLRNHPGFLKLLFTGTESEELVAISRKMGIKAKSFESWDASAIRRKVDASLSAGNPVIIGSEPQIHWICLGGRTDEGGYVWADSANDPVLGAFGSWSEVEDWMTWSDKDGDYSKLAHPFEVITMEPGRGMPRSRTLVPWIDSIWPQLAADPNYAGNWSNLLSDMLDVFWDLSYAPKGRPAGKFLDQHIDAVINSISPHTSGKKSCLRDIALGYRDAADFHNLVVPNGEEIGCITAFAVKVAAKAKASSAQYSRRCA